MVALNSGEGKDSKGQPATPNPTSEAKSRSSNATIDSSSGTAEADDPSKIEGEELMLSTDTPMLLIAVLFKEAALDSPTFRSSMNHLNLQFENFDRWLDSFIKATQKLSQEMEGKCIKLQLT